MKKIILIIVIYLFIIVSCNKPCKTNSEFEEFYFTMIDAITSYGKQFDTDDEVVFEEEKWSNFLDYTDYLRFLTHHEFQYIIIELPIYENQSDLEADIKDLNKWYQENKCGMTKEKADSMVNERKE